jgi:deoxyribodipyrimidine photolyase
MDKRLEEIFLFTYNKVLNTMRAEFLEQIGFYNQFINDKISINNAKQYFTERIKKEINTKQIKGPVLDKFILKNTGEIAFKNKTAYNTVRLFLKEHPNTSLEELRLKFEFEGLNLRRLFKELKEVTDKDKKPIKRYFYEPDKVLVTGDNKKVVFTTQFGLNFSNFIEIAKKMGYTITPYNQ